MRWGPAGGAAAAGSSVRVLQARPPAREAARMRARVVWELGAVLAVVNGVSVWGWRSEDGEDGVSLSDGICEATVSEIVLLLCCWLKKPLHCYHATHQGPSDTSQQPSAQRWQHRSHCDLKK